jgi:protein-L-isoaspartate(D-aspartate) O-methyltransferase
MFNEDQLAILRRAYARQVTFLSGAQNRALEDAYAEVRREDFVGDGPWQVVTPFLSGAYRVTPDADPGWLYSDILVGIVPERHLNNGQPSGHAAWIGAAGPKPGDHVVHVGAGVGYYSAIMGHMAGPGGSLTAIEYDPELALRARANLAHMPNATVICGDGSVTPFAPADVIYINAGCTRPADLWLDNLKDGGRLLLMLTTNANFAPNAALRGVTGGIFLITRRGEAFAVKFEMPVWVFPCEGMRDEASEAALAAAFETGGYQKVTRLWRGAPPDDVGCWVKAPGWALS